MSESIAINPAITSLALTLIHFLWQGVLVALVLKVALTFISFRQSQLRYVLSSVAMVANLVLPFITFLIIYTLEQKQTITLLQSLPILSKNFSIEHVQTTAWYSQWFDLLPFVTFTWAGIVTLLALKLLVELFNVNKLPTYGTTPADRALQKRFDELVNKIELSRSVKLLLSTKVNVPMAIGCLKPVVLIPVSMISGLTPQQLDMLLLHELAHIRRHDYLVNFLQTIVEILLFFHPAVRWVSKQMRNEREYCSDDIAIQYGGSPIAYAHTLADTATLCQKHRCHSTPAMAMAASGGDLKQRVTRLLSDQHHCSHSNDSGKWLASLTIILAIVVSFLQNSLTINDIDIQSGKLPFFYSSNNSNHRTIENNPIQKKSPLAEQLIAMEKGEADKLIVTAKKDVELASKTTSFTENNLSDSIKFISSPNLLLDNELPIVTSNRANIQQDKLQAKLTKKEELIIEPSKNSFAEKAFERTDSTLNSSIMDNPYSSQVASLSEETIQKTPLPEIKNSSANSEDLSKIETISIELPQKIEHQLNHFVANDVSDKLINDSRNVASLLTSVEPKYPFKAKRNGVELEIMVEFDIDKNGYVKNINFESKSKVSLFRRSIRNALAKWRFLPALENGVPVESKMSKIFSFSLLK